MRAGTGWVPALFCLQDLKHKHDKHFCAILLFWLTFKSFELYE